MSRPRMARLHRLIAGVIASERAIARGRNDAIAALDNVTVRIAGALENSAPTFNRELFYALSGIVSEDAEAASEQ